MGIGAVGKTLHKPQRNGRCGIAGGQLQQLLQYLPGLLRLRHGKLPQLADSGIPPVDMVPDILVCQCRGKGGKHLRDRIRLVRGRIARVFQQQGHVMDHRQAEFPHHGSVRLLRQLPVDAADGVRGHILPDSKDLAGITAGLSGAIGIAVRRGHAALLQQNGRLEQNGQHREGAIRLCRQRPLKQAEQVADPHLRYGKLHPAAVGAVHGKGHLPALLRQQAPFQPAFGGFPGADILAADGQIQPGQGQHAGVCDGQNRLCLCALFPGGTHGRFQLHRFAGQRQQPQKGNRNHTHQHRGCARVVFKEERHCGQQNRPHPDQSFTHDTARSLPPEAAPAPPVPSGGRLRPSG